MKSLKILIILLPLITLTGCSSLGSTGSFSDTICGWFSSEDSKDPKTGTEAIEDKSQDTLEWLAVASIISLAVTLVLGFKFPMLHELTPLFGIGFIACWALAWFIELLALIKWIALIAAIAYAGFRIYLLKSKHDREIEEERGKSQELALHFDDPDGESKLSKKAHEAYTMGRPPRTLDKTTSKD